MSHCHRKPSAWAVASGFWYLKPEPWAVTGLSDSLWWPRLPTAQLGRLKALSLSRHNTILVKAPDFWRNWVRAWIPLLVPRIVVSVIVGKTFQSIFLCCEYLVHFGNLIPAMKLRASAGHELKLTYQMVRLYYSFPPLAIFPDWLHVYWKHFPQ